MYSMYVSIHVVCRMKRCPRLSRGSGPKGDLFNLDSSQWRRKEERQVFGYGKTIKCTANIWACLTCFFVNQLLKNFD